MFPKAYCRRVNTTERNTAGSHNSGNSRIATAHWIECLMCLCFMDSAGWLFIKDSIAHLWLPGDGHVSSCKNLQGFQPSWFLSSHNWGLLYTLLSSGSILFKSKTVANQSLCRKFNWKSIRCYVIILRGLSQRDYGNVLEFEASPGV